MASAHLMSFKICDEDNRKHHHWTISMLAMLPFQVPLDKILLRPRPCAMRIMPHCSSGRCASYRKLSIIR